MKTIVLVVAVLIGITGCAAPMVWQKSGATQSDYNTDSYACEKDSRQSGYYGGGIAGALAMKDFFKRCMVSKGYEIQATQ